MSTKNTAPATAIDERSGREYRVCGHAIPDGGVCMRYTGHTKGDHRPTLARPVPESRAKWLAMSPEEQAAVKAERAAKHQSSKRRPAQAAKAAKAPTAAKNRPGAKDRQVLATA